MMEQEFATPMMLQYLELKKQYPGCLLLFRLGDFYELFLDDAKLGAEILGITLTSRARGKDGRIPMAGVPYHAIDHYLGKFIKAGYKVAICEQMSEPDGRSLVEREVVRIITPGTVTDEKSLQRKENNYLVSLNLEKKTLGVAATDISTSEFVSGEFTLKDFASLEELLSLLITQFNPSEYLLSSSLEKYEQSIRALTQHKHSTLSWYGDWAPLPTKSQPALKKYFSAAVLPTLPILTQPQAMTASVALLSYLHYTQKTDTSQHIRTIQPLFLDNYLHMNRSTMANLELFHSLGAQSDQSTVIDCLDHTSTAMGGRLLRQWLRRPLIHKQHIEARLEAVQFLLENSVLYDQLHEHLSQIPDVERLLSRISMRICTPRDVKSVAGALELFRQVKDVAAPYEKKLPSVLRDHFHAFSSPLEAIEELINHTLMEHPPLDPRQGGLIQRGIDTELDKLHAITMNSREWIAQLEASEKEKTGIGSLKIKFNQVFGFYIEVSKANLQLVPASYMRKQTLVNAERFMTPELKEHEEIILTAEEKIQELEYHIFMELIEKVIVKIDVLQRATQAIAHLDCLHSFAELGRAQNYHRPIITTNGEIKILGGRHPVVERTNPNAYFIPNDVYMNTTDHQLLLITGPNMAGKSVLMRQVALITLLAHIGSFVPAEEAHISLTDQIFVRSGAADMITAGLSTFMVEMVETASILHHATNKSLVIMDEIGRGTSTYDGISIAWAIAEFLINQPQHKPKTLFATHYHELQELSEKYPDKMKSYHMAITEHEGKPVFLYTLTQGGASHSFGVAVAELAGVPASVITRAKELLQEMEHHQPLAKHTQKKAQPKASKNTPNSPLVSELEMLDINTISPLESLQLLARWKEQLSKEK